MKVRGCLQSRRLKALVELIKEKLQPNQQRAIHSNGLSVGGLTDLT